MDTKPSPQRIQLWQRLEAAIRSGVEATDKLNGMGKRASLSDSERNAAKKQVRFAWADIILTLEELSEEKGESASTDHIQ